jgi:hypothetical protein
LESRVAVAAVGDFSPLRHRTIKRTSSFSLVSSIRLKCHSFFDHDDVHFFVSTKFIGRISDRCMSTSTLFFSRINQNMDQKLFRGFNDRVRVMKGYQKGMNIEDLEMNE